MQRIFNALKTGIKLFTQKAITFKFPPESPISERFRGRHIFHPEECMSCGLCCKECPNLAIQMIEEKKNEKTFFFPSIDYSKCCFCGLCVDVCPNNALEMTNFSIIISKRKKDLIFSPESLTQPPVLKDPKKPKRKNIVSWARSRSLWIINYFTGCCFIETVSWIGSGFDMERFGMIVKGSPLHSDVLLIGGYVTYKTLKRIFNIYKAMAQPKFVLVLGNCPMTGGVYWDSYNTIKRIDDYIPVDMFIAGCPARPEAIGIAAYQLIKAIEGGYMPRESSIRTHKKIQYRNTDDLKTEPYIKKVGSDESIITFGPQHPASGNFSIKLIVKGETINSAESIVGYLHRGIEKLGEYRTWYQNLMLVPRVCVFDGASYEIGYMNAIEKLLEIEVPERTSYLRVIQAELSRIQSHLLNLGFVAYSSGFETVMKLTFGYREKILFLLEELTGARIYQLYNIPGGIRNDISEGFKKNLPKVISFMKNKFKILDDLFIENPVFRKRTINLGEIVRKSAIESDITGPNLRASGVKFDVRKTSPYSAYDKLHFDIPTFENGDAYHRVLLRRIEIEKSLELIEECMEKLPEGAIKVKYNPIQKIPEGEALSFVESARGELCFHLVSDGGRKPYRMKIRGPTFDTILFLMPKLLKNCFLADVPLIYWSLDNCPSDHDR